MASRHRAKVEHLETRTLLAALPRVRLFADTSVTREEGSALRFTIERDTTALASPLTVKLAASGTASAADYDAIPATVTLPANQRTATLAILPANDTLVEAREELVLSVQPDPAYRLTGTASRVARGTIFDNDDLPPGTAVVNDASLGGFFVFGATSNTVSAGTGVPFTSARRITLATRPPNAYDAQVRGDATVAINAGDRLLLSFWLRSVDGSPVSVTGLLERDGPPYEKSGSLRVSTRSTQWQKYYVPAQALASYAAGDLSVAFHIGGQVQQFDIGGIEVRNYGAAVSFAQLPYSNAEWQGRSGSSTAWRDAADARIEQLRKSPLHVDVRDSSGNAVANASVRVRLDQHAFGFGSAVDSFSLLQRPLADRTPYQNIIRENFSKVVLENDLKWPGWQDNAQRALNALDWLNQNGIADVRGHTLIWPYWQNIPATPGTTYGGINYRADPNKPDSQEEYEAHVAVNGAAAARTWLENRILAHIAQQLTHPQIKGRLRDWDVINEAVFGNEVLNVVGQDELVKWLAAARAADPAARLFVNDYPPLDAGAHLDAFYDQLASLVAQGAAIDAVGLQGHVGSSTPDIDRVLATYDRFAQLGLDMQITEFDITHPDEQVQADYLRDLMTATFSHPNFDAFVIWGFWEGQHWLPEAALWRRDWSIKPSGQQFIDLINAEWTTDVTATSGSSGAVDVVGFHGRYIIDVTINGATHSFVRSLTPGGTSTQVVIPDTLPPAVAASSFEFDRPTPEIQVIFSEDVGTSVTAADFVLTRHGETSSVIDPADLVLSYVPATRTATLRYTASASSLPDGTYTLVLPAGRVVDLSGNASTSPHQLSFHVLAGDANRDRKVDFSDLLILAQNYGQGGKTFSQGNFNYSGDGLVDFADLLMLAQRYGTSLLGAVTAAPAAAPTAATKRSTARRSAAADLM